MRRLIALFLGYATRLRFPWLAALTAALFALDVIVPDAVPFADEVLLGLLTAVFASWRRRRGAQPGGDVREEPGGAPGSR